MLVIKFEATAKHYSLHLLSLKLLLEVGISFI